MRTVSTPPWLPPQPWSASQCPRRVRDRRSPALMDVTPTDPAIAVLAYVVRARNRVRLARRFRAHTDRGHGRPSCRRQNRADDVRTYGAIGEPGSRPLTVWCGIAMDDAA